MIDEANADRLTDFIAAWNAHDADAVMGFFADDCIYLASFGPHEDGTVFRGRGAVQQGVRAFLHAFPDAHYSDVRAFTKGNHGLATWTFSGTRPSGERVLYRGVDVFEFEGAQIKKKDAFRKERAAALGGT